MRPVNKGSSPYKTISKYADALPFLEKTLGLYCSYCEFPIAHLPEVEHVSAKSKGGDLTNWDNLLLGCKYCNTRKGDKVTPDNRSDYLWPDEDNTALAYTYKGGLVQVNAADLNQIDPSGTRLNKAQKLFDLIHLGNIPTPKEKDRRFAQRNTAYELAKDALEDWQKAQGSTPAGLNALKRQIVQNALGHGFFSVWMTVFKDEPDILLALIQAFPGTNQAFFDHDYHPKYI